MKTLKIALFLATGLIGWQAVPASATFMPEPALPKWHIQWDNDLDHETQWNHGDHQICLAALSRTVLTNWPVSGGSLVQTNRGITPIPFAEHNLSRPEIQEAYDLRLHFTDGAYKVSLRANCSYGVLTARYQVRNTDWTGKVRAFGYSLFRHPKKKRETSMEILDLWKEYSARGSPLVQFVLDNLTQQDQIALLDRMVAQGSYPKFLLHPETMKNGLDINLSLRKDPVSHKGF